MRNFIVWVYLSLVWSCQNTPATNINTPTHIVTCSKVHLRDEPNQAAASKGLIAENEQVTYLKETFYTEIIPVKNRRQAEKWYFVMHRTKSGATESGWVYAGCLTSLPGISIRQIIDPVVYLTNRHIIKAGKIQLLRQYLAIARVINWI